MPMAPRLFARLEVLTRRITRTYYSALKTFDLDLIVRSVIPLLGGQAPARLKRFPSCRNRLARDHLGASWRRGDTQALRDLLLSPLTRSSDVLRTLTGWGFSTFSAFLEELEVLGLKGKCFGPSEYAHALAAYLGIQIEIEIVDDAEDPRSARGFVSAGHTACL